MKEKVVFITGAKGGLGSFITRRYLETGVTVFQVRRENISDFECLQAPKRSTG